MHGSRIYSPVLNILIPCTVNSVPFWFDNIQTYHPLILREEGLLLEITALKFIVIIIIVIIIIYNGQSFSINSSSVTFALRFFADTDQGSMILDGRKIWTRRVTTKKKANVDFSSWKKNTNAYTENWTFC